MSEFNRHALGTVAASAIGLALAFGTVIIATFGLFLIAMNQEFGWGMGRAASLLSVAALAQAPLSPLVGRFIDRIGVRRVVLPGIVLYGASIMALSLAGRSPVQLYVLFLLVGATSSLVTMLPYSKAVSA
ncbi:MFS transporter [Sphingomonas sanguinis]|uniref:MFS transporter n=1 Tax=Sphingomonas sp. LC-1 TaxID=3110957 RepID=UPI0021BB4847|nr:MFS transporter [Sphingomonas sp. LC-1]MCT8003161.1 MFS transporter [Sphingomonas sp. LC-1]